MIQKVISSNAIQSTQIKDMVYAFQDILGGIATTLSLVTLSAQMNVMVSSFIDTITTIRLWVTPSDQTIIICSHDFRSIARYCTRVFYLEKGKVTKVLTRSEYDFFLKKQN